MTIHIVVTWATIPQSVTGDYQHTLAT